MKLSVEEADELVRKIKYGHIKYNPDVHPSMLLRIMSDPEKSRMTAFCAEVGIGEATFYNWMKKDELLLKCYALGKILSRENWEREGLKIKEDVLMPGMIS